MKSKLIKKSGSKLTLEIEIDLDPTSMLNSESQIASALNEAGVLATGEALELFDTDGRPLSSERGVMSSKGKQKKHTKRPMDR